jgi:hypothetical protein
MNAWADFPACSAASAMRAFSASGSFSVVVDMMVVRANNQQVTPK